MRAEEQAILERRMRDNFERSLPTRMERHARIPVQTILPLEFFVEASRELRQLFIDERFYSCIVLAQSVAEGIARFIAEKKGVRVVNDYAAQVNLLQRDRQNPAISQKVFKAFKRVHGKDRNDFHHLNPTVPQDRRELDRRAEECLLSLYEIESEVFAFHPVDGGKIHLVHPEYWAISPNGAVLGHVNFT